jgi:hypothetical protein
MGVVQTVKVAVAVVVVQALRVVLVLQVVNFLEEVVRQIQLLELL